MTAPLAFRVDAASCSGCKACQMACKDKHDLPVGVLWRRVYEVSGGGWQREGDAWRADAFAFNLPVACNHCADPICVEVCPTRAMHQRDDGIVLVDAGTCVGCRYCEWACPYGAPQYDARSGRMTKCTMCVDLLEAGQLPACAAACPMRVLDVVAFEPPGVDHHDPTATWPLPDATLTQPRLVVRPHRDAGRATAMSATVGLRDETRPRARRFASGDWPLVAFTLLMQLSAGALLVALAYDALTGEAATGHVLPAVVAAALLGVASSLLHLGTPHNAWRAMANLRTSWLSREVACTLVYVTAALALNASRISADAHPGAWRTIAVVASLAAIAMLYAIARVYRLRTVPAWDKAHLTTAFVGTALALGALAVATFEVVSRAAAQHQAFASLPPVASIAALAAALSAAVLARRRHYAARHTRAL